MLNRVLLLAAASGSIYAQSVGTDITGGSGLTTSNAIPFFTSPTGVSQSSGAFFDPLTTAIQIGINVNQFEFRPNFKQPYGVMQVRSTKVGGSTAWDISPNTDSTKGAWIDTCVDDLTISKQNWRCMVAYATPDAYFLGVHHSNFATQPSKPLYIGGQLLEFRANGPFWGHSMGRLEDLGLTLFDATNDRPYFSLLKSDQRLRITSSMQLTWSSTDSVYDANDVGLTRRGPKVLKATNAGTGFGNIDAAQYRVLGTPGVTTVCTGAPRSMTVVGGVITAIDCPH